MGGGHAQTFQGAGNILYLDMGFGCMCASLCKNSSSGTLKISTLTSVLQTYSVNSGGFVLEYEGNDLVTLLGYATLYEGCVLCYL